MNIKAASVSQNAHKGSLGGVRGGKGEAANARSSVLEITILSGIEGKSEDFSILLAFIHLKSPTFQSFFCTVEMKVFQMIANQHI